MFPSSGYFRGVVCPFYASGLCERPYCHFRHSKIENERTTKTDKGPTYSSSSISSYQSANPLNTGPLPSTEGVSTKLSSSLASYTTAGSSVASAPVEAYETSRSESNGPESDRPETGVYGDGLPIPSFSSSQPTLPESEAQPAIAIEALPKISGLPKLRKNLPSYVPTPKTQDSVPSYSPTPKSQGNAHGKKSRNVIEYDPEKNFAYCDKSKESEEEEEEAAFSDCDDDEDVKGTKNGDGSDSTTIETDKQAPREEERTQATSNGRTISCQDDDLTDSDEDVTWPSKDVSLNDNQDTSSDFAHLLTPSSFFTEKLASSETKNNHNDSEVSSSSSKHSSQAYKKSTSHSRPKHAKDSLKAHKSKSTERRNSINSDSSSCSGKRTSSSNHKLSSSSSKSKDRLSKNEVSSSSSASASSLKKSHSSSSSSHKDPNSRVSSSSSSTKDSSRHKLSLSSSSSSLSQKDLNSSHKSSSLSSSSSSKKDSHKHKSSSSSSSSSNKDPKNEKSSSSNKHKSSSTSSSYKRDPKDLRKDSKSLPTVIDCAKSPPVSSTMEKPHGSSSEKENKHKLHSSSSKSHSVSRSLSSSSSSSSTSLEQSDRNLKRSEQRIRSNPGSNTKTEKSQGSQGDIKPSVTATLKVKSKVTEDNLGTLAIMNGKSEKKKQNSESSVSSSGSKVPKVPTKSSCNSTPVKREKNRSHTRSNSTSEGESKNHEKLLNIVKPDGGSGFESDSDIEIIEPPPVPVYDISDSDSEGGGAGRMGKKGVSDSHISDYEMMSDDGDAEDTFDECLRIFQESERQIAERLKRGELKTCADKGKMHPTEEPDTFDASEDLLASVGKKRMAHANSVKVSRLHKSVAPARQKLSPAEVMHNRIVDMQKRALLRAAKREGRESDLPVKLASPTKTLAASGIHLKGGGLPAASGSSSSSIAGSSSNKRWSISPSILPPNRQTQRQAHTPSASLFPGHKTPPRRPSSDAVSKGESSSSSSSSNFAPAKPSSKFTMSPNTFYHKKPPALPSSSSSSSSAVAGGKKVVTIAGTASKVEKRKAHEPTLSNLKRPLIPAEFGGKVPTNVRQRYLNFIIDEHLKFRSEEEAYMKGEEDEKAVYEKSTNKNIYLRVAVNTIKRIRTEAAQHLPSTSKKPRLEGPCSGPKVGHMAQSHAATLGGRNAARFSYTLNRSSALDSAVPAKIEGKELYERLKQYIMSETELRENGYPRPSEDGSSKVQFYKSDTADEMLLKDNERVCRRCGKRFNVTKDGEPISNGLCMYHHANAYKKKVFGVIESRYGCCNERAGTKGCQVATYHVHERNKKDNLSGYMKTMPAEPSSPKNHKVLSLDCEMVYTRAGLELARVTVIGEHCEVLYETLVKPDTDIIDYNTRFSGITAVDMKGVSTNIRGVQAVMLSMISDKTILMGHSLESDLIALKLIHSTVVDTSLVFPHRLGPPYKRALRHLMLDHLKKIIQADDSGHDSKEDAVACMQLMMYKVKEDAKKFKRY